MKKTFVILIALFLTGCGSTITPARYCYMATATVVHSVDLGMNVAGDLYRAGNMSVITKDKLIAAHKVYQPVALLAIAGCQVVKTQADAEAEVAKLQVESDKMTTAFVSAGAR